MSILTGYVLPFVILTLVLLALYKRHRSGNRPPLPPGPASDPVIGHLLKIPRTKQAEAFTEMGKAYGDVVYLSALGKRILILNSHHAAVDLLDKRGLIYSDRAYFPVYDLLGLLEGLPLSPYNDEFQKHRKITQQPLSRKGIEVFRGIMINHTETLLKALLDKPEDFQFHLTQYVSANIVEATYGHKVEDQNDSFVKMSIRVNEILEGAGVPGTSLVDVFPFLRHLPSWFPGAWYVRYGKLHKPFVNHMFRAGLEEVQSKMAEGTAQPSFLSEHLRNFTQDGRNTAENLRALEVNAGFLFGAGFDTTYSSLMNFFLALLNNPQAVKRAQAEIDEVIGPDRLPTFDDKDSLPAVEALLYEGLRWHQSVPLGLPHFIRTDDIYNGFLIPKDTMVLANMRAMTMDEKTYSNPHVFNPDRYLPAPIGNSEPFPDFTFGFGRRICPGRFFAHQNDFGKDIVPPEEYTDSVTSHAVPYKCRFVPRSEKARILVEKL
ncbi:cytochrome P450 family protein [Abortiporus biennis]